MYPLSYEQKGNTCLYYKATKQKNNNIYYTKKGHPPEVRLLPGVHSDVFRNYRISNSPDSRFRGAVMQIHRNSHIPRSGTIRFSFYRQSQPLVEKD